ncbi:Ribosome maturation protein SDO1 [Candidatus Methanoperedenaceae archaeon GB50]|nr:Ribosome maturation protein SDO1 [Candidatus Methanoperedenaceae archaeon GB50]CAD7771514.1 Ribosome maturation protein SDO1 [Candidatus Methanoperedenaceae archaeon GB50]CAD7773217.1 MAG: Ribosome maturation protein SDO1 [Candidatus Methanoperedenaceae archaeon GB50]CAD7775988.1 MAG: Ribosome maturation protein SDO1 [Candidatus Methanoperedenaceae archaeon GB50]
MTLQVRYGGVSGLVRLEDAVVARLRRGGVSFEVLVDPSGAESLRSGESLDLEDLLAVEDVFLDARTGERPSQSDLVRVFGTSDRLEVARRIVSEGEIHLTALQRRRLQEEKTRRIVSFIARNAINPQTGAPHPPERVERALREAGVHVDPLKSVDEEVGRVMKAIRPIIPIRFEEVDLAVKVSSIFSGRVRGVLSRFGRILEEEWQSDGSWIGVLRLPAGLQDDLYEALNRLTHGEVETRLVKRG